MLIITALRFIEVGVLRARLFVVCGAVLFSTGGVAIKLSMLSGWQVSCLRSAVAALVLGGFLVGSGARWTWRAWVVAIPYAATFTLYALANKLTTAANAIFLQDTAPLYILLLAPLVIGERARRGDIAFLLVLIAGLCLIFFPMVDSGPMAVNPALGNLLGVCSGLSWALTLLGLRWLALRACDGLNEPLTAVVAGCVLAAVVGAVFGYPFGGVAPSDWLIIAYLGVVQISLAYLFVTTGIREISALGASLLLLVEPVLTPVWAWLILREMPGPLVIIGGGVVLAATVAYAIREVPQQA